MQGIGREREALENRERSFEKEQDFRPFLEKGNGRKGTLGDGGGSDGGDGDGGGGGVAEARPDNTFAAGTRRREMGDVIGRKGVPNFGENALKVLRVCQLWLICLKFENEQTHLQFYFLYHNWS